jgi:hypothetical protein
MPDQRMHRSVYDNQLKNIRNIRKNTHTQSILIRSREMHPLEEQPWPAG